MYWVVVNYRWRVFWLMHRNDSSILPIRWPLRRTWRRKRRAFNSISVLLPLCPLKWKFLLRCLIRVSTAVEASWPVVIGCSISGDGPSGSKLPECFTMRGLINVAGSDLNISLNMQFFLFLRQFSSPHRLCRMTGNFFVVCFLNPSKYSFFGKGLYSFAQKGT